MKETGLDIIWQGWAMCMSKIRLRMSVTCRVGHDCDRDGHECDRVGLECDRAGHE